MRNDIRKKSLFWKLNRGYLLNLLKQLFLVFLIIILVTPSVNASRKNTIKNPEKVKEKIEQEIERLTSEQEMSEDYEVGEKRLMGAKSDRSGAESLIRRTTPRILELKRAAQEISDKASGIIIEYSIGAWQIINKFMDFDKKLDIFAGYEYSMFDNVTLMGQRLIPRQNANLIKIGGGYMDFLHADIKITPSDYTFDLENGQSIYWGDVSNSYASLSYNYIEGDLKIFYKIIDTYMPYIFGGANFVYIKGDTENLIDISGFSYGFGMDIRLYKGLLLGASYTVKTCTINNITYNGITSDYTGGDNKYLSNSARVYMTLFYKLPTEWFKK